MKEYDKHIDFFKQLESPFDQSEDELWDKIASKTIDKPQARVFTLKWYGYAAAAVVLIFFGTGLFFNLYTETIQSEKGKHLSIALPDGSTVELNAETTISFKPYWWRFSREVELSGEAFFDVEKGEKFEIVSDNGITKVLGTSFNIYARDADYKVYCKTGKVMVSSTKSSVELTINPGEMAVLNNQLKKGQIEKASSEIILGWQDNKFAFTSEQLPKVIRELERQYNVTIDLTIQNPSDVLYTGFFNKTSSVEPTLNIICKSLDLTYKKDKNKGYVISLNN